MAFRTLADSIEAWDVRIVRRNSGDNRLRLDGSAQRAIEAGAPIRVANAGGEGFDAIH